MTISTSQFIVVNVGTNANDGTGDSLRTAFVKVNQNFSNITDVGFNAGNIAVQKSLEVLGSALIQGNLTVASDYVPDSAVANGTQGQIAFDNDFLYICVDNNTWKRISLESW
jgi:hypothetical protein